MSRVVAASQKWLSRLEWLVAAFRGLLVGNQFFIMHSNRGSDMQVTSI